MVRKYVSYFLVCVLTLLFSFLILTVFCKFNFNVDTFYNFLDSSSYYEEVKSVISDNLKGFVEQSGLNEDIIDSSVTLDVIKLDVKSIVDSIFFNTKFVRSSNFKNLLSSNINNYVSSNNISFDVNQKKSINDLIILLDNTYFDDLLIPSAIPIVAKVVNFYFSNINKFIIIIFAIFIVLLFVLLCINFNRKFFVYFSTFVIFACVLIVCFCLFFYFRLNLSNIFIFNVAFSNLIKFIFYDLFFDLLFVCLLLFFLSLLFHFFAVFFYK